MQDPKSSPTYKASRIFALPQRWPDWPILCVIRGEGSMEQVVHNKDEDFGIMYDLFHSQPNIPGYSSTVFLVGMVPMPRSIAALLQVPKEVYDTPEEVAVAGWRPAEEQRPMIKPEE